jgi:site-specific recombinase XerD
MLNSLTKCQACAKGSTPAAQSPELFAAYLAHIRPVVTAATMRHKSWQIRWFEDFLAKRGIKPADVRKPDIDAFMQALAHCATRTLRIRVATVRDLYTFAAKTHPVDYGFPNPAADVAFLRNKRRTLPHVPEEETIKEHLSQLADSNEPRMVRNRAMLELAYGSGLRRCELAALDIEEIDFDKAQAYIRGKGGKTRIVPVSESALCALRDYLRERSANHASTRLSNQGPLFVTVTGKRVSIETVGWIFHSKIGIRAHLLRHACATHMLRRGCEVRLVQELLGHAYLTTTQRYTHITGTDVEKMVAKLHPRAGELTR